MAIMRRHRPRGLLSKIREALWPSMGWRRTFHYYRHRMFRTGDSTYKIAAGLAMGAALSFTPFLGTHILQAMFMSWLIRASVVSGAVGTAVGTPWTYPIMFILAYKLGIWLCATLGISDFSVLPDNVVIAEADHEPWLFLQHMVAHPVKILLPLAIGGYLCAAIAWPVYYALLYYPVRWFKKAYVRKRHHKRKARR